MNNNNKIVVGVLGGRQGFFRSLYGMICLQGFLEIGGSVIGALQNFSFCFRLLYAVQMKSRASTEPSRFENCYVCKRLKTIFQRPYLQAKPNYQSMDPFLKLISPIEYHSNSFDRSCGGRQNDVLTAEEGRFPSQRVT